MTWFDADGTDHFLAKATLHKAVGRKSDKGSEWINPWAKTIRTEFICFLVVLNVPFLPVVIIVSSVPSVLVLHIVLNVLGPLMGARADRAWRCQVSLARTCL